MSIIILFNGRISDVSKRRDSGYYGKREADRYNDLATSVFSTDSFIDDMGVCDYVEAHDHVDIVAPIYRSLDPDPNS